MDTTTHEPQPVATRRRYSDQEQADAIATVEACGGNISEAAEALDIPHETIRGWIVGLRRPPIPQLVDAAKAALADRYERIVGKLLDVVEDPDKLDKMSGAAAMLASGIATDKMLLLRGEATSIHATQDDSRLALFRANYGKLHTVTDAKTVDAATTAAEPGPKPGEGENAGKQGDS